jgi:hypothetical protein
MADAKEQVIYLRFYIELGKTAGEAYKMLEEAFADNSAAVTQTYEW